MACIGTAVSQAWHRRSAASDTRITHIEVRRIARINRLTGRNGCTSRRALVSVAAAASGGEVTLTSSNGSSSVLSGELYTVGTSTDSDFPISDGNCQENHARLECKQGRVFCTALAGDPEDFLCSTLTWLNGNELRRGVAYLVKPGSTLAFGQADNTITVDFDEHSSASPALEMVMQGMASSSEVKKRISSD